MGHVGPEVLAHDDVPGGAVSSIELLLDLGRDIFLDVKFFECGCGDVHGLLLHLLTHVDIFYDSLG